MSEWLKQTRLLQKVLDLMSVYVPSSHHRHLSAPHSSHPALIFIGWGRAELQQLEDSFCSFETQMSRDDKHLSLDTWQKRVKYIYEQKKADSEFFLSR